MKDDDFPVHYHPRPSRLQSVALWAILLIVVFAAGVFCGSSASAETTAGPLEPAAGTWRAYRGTGFTTLVCSASSETAVMACAAADAERRGTTTRYQLRYPNRYILITYVVPPPPRTAALSWTAPTRNTDGSTLTNLAGYRVHYGRSATELVRTLEISSPAPTSAVVADIASGS